MRNDFVVFILSHGRPHNVYTVDTLKKSGYTGKIYIIIDNEDSQADEYYNIFGKENVIMFNKKEISKTFDTADLSEDRKTIVYARNACFDIAEQLGLDYFLELDDDYTEFRSRVICDDVLASIYVRDLDSIIDECLLFLEKTKAKTVAFSQIGDFVAGKYSSLLEQRIKRKAMNSFFCKTSNRFTFLGRINEDVNTYTYLGSKGELFFTIADVSLNQLETQSNKGGMTDVYLDNGTYVKSFYTVMYCPSSVKISSVGSSKNGHLRIHHKVNWNKCVPKIISDRFKIKE